MNLIAAFLVAVTLSTTVYRSELPMSEIRQRLAGAPQQKFVSIVDLPITREAAALEADEIMKSKVWRALDEEVSMVSPIRWMGYSRSFSFALNAWSPVVPFYIAAGLDADERYFREGYRIALDWGKENVPPIRDIATHEAMDALIGEKGESVWYDMSTGVRVYPLAWTLNRIAQKPECTDEELKLFVDGLYFHMEALGRPFYFQAHNNHGFFQAVGQLMAAKQVPGLPRMDEYGALALSRLEKVVEKQFTPTWVHKEHSPAYHESLLRTFLALRTVGISENPKLLHGIEAMEDALSWMYTPNFRHTAFGDTSGDNEIFSEQLVKMLQNEQLIYQVTKGAQGKVPENGVRTYLDAGYTFARFTPEGGSFAQTSYLAQMSAFHSRTHKHADHASFVWYDRGEPILVDAGRYGYTERTPPDSELHKKGFWYADPNRIYVESTRAHNTIEIDRDDLPRAKVKPFGSFLKAGEAQGALVVTESDGMYTKTQRHRRILVFKPSEFLIVIDVLRDKAPHTYTQWFTFDPRWEVILDGGIVQAVAEGRQTLFAQSLLRDALPLPIARGQKEPRMQGWYSDKDRSIVPASSIGFEESEAEVGRFVTLFTFGGKLEADPGTQKINKEMTDLRLQWAVDGQKREIRVSAPHGKPVKVKQVK